jgi:hypothetical protein
LGNGFVNLQNRSVGLRKVPVILQNPADGLRKTAGGRRYAVSNASLIYFNV